MMSSSGLKSQSECRSYETSVSSSGHKSQSECRSYETSAHQNIKAQSARLGSRHSKA